MAKEDVSIKRVYLAVNFGMDAKKWEGCKDDRGLFASIYANLLDAVEEFCTLDIQNALINVGFNEIFQQKFEELKALKQSLKERGMI